MADRYSGYYEHSLDPKGRITIPSKFRDQLGKTIAMMRGKGGCIELYSLTEWNAVYEKFEKIDENDEEAYNRMRKLLATSVDDNEMDRQGRLLVPTTLRAYAKLEKDVVISGGENLYPVQIEDFLRTNDKIKDVAVIGLPDARLGEIAAAIIQIKDGMTCTESEINQFCTELPRYKRPRKIIFAPVPRNATGKIEKPGLREKYCKGRLVEAQTTR